MDPIASGGGRRIKGSTFAVTTQPSFLCHATSLREGEALSVVVEVSGTRHDILVFNRNGAIYAYVNACPHQHTPLETFPGKFFDAEGNLLVCSTHGARFEPESGLCVSGPCEGKSLTKISLTERDGGLYARL